MEKYNYIKLGIKPFWDLVLINEEILSKGVDCVTTQGFYGVESIEERFSAKDAEKIKDDLTKHFSNEFRTKVKIEELNFVCWMMIDKHDAYPVLAYMSDDANYNVGDLLLLLFETMEINNNSQNNK